MGALRDQPPSPKIEKGVRACLRVCVGTDEPLSNYWLMLMILRDDQAWSTAEVAEVRERFVDASIDDKVQSVDIAPGKTRSLG